LRKTLEVYDVSCVRGADADDLCCSVINNYIILILIIVLLIIVCLIDHFEQIRVNDDDVDDDENTKYSV